MHHETDEFIARSLRDLTENAEAALKYAKEVAKWLLDEKVEQATARRIKRACNPWNLPEALELLREVEEVDALLREGIASSRALPPSHRLVNRLGAMRRISLDLRNLGERLPRSVRRLLDGADSLDVARSLVDAKALARPERHAEVGALALGPSRRDRVTLVLVVEDDAWWRETLVAKAQARFPKTKVEALSTFASAKARFDKLSGKPGVLVLLDLGLPESEEGESADDTTRGRQLLEAARAYKNSWRVVVVTTPRNYLIDQVVATQLGVRPEDYIFKLSDAWEAEIDESLRRLAGLGLPRVDIACDHDIRSGEITAGDVRFRLAGQPFVVLKTIATAPNQRASEENIVARLVQNEEEFWGLESDDDVLSLSDTLRKIRRAFVDAYAQVGRRLWWESVLRTIDSTVVGGKPTYHLVPPARVIEAGTVTPSAADEVRRALVVDDDPIDAGQAAAWLERLGLEVKVRASVDAALECARSFLPQIVCLDLALPRESGGAIDMEGGLALLDALEALPGMSDARVMVVSAVAGDDRIRHRGLLRGIRIDDWLAKTNPYLQSYLIRSAARLRAEIEQGVVLSANARSPWVLEISSKRPYASLDGTDLKLGRSEGGWAFLKLLAKSPYQPVSLPVLGARLKISTPSKGKQKKDPKAAHKQLAQSLRGRAKRLRDAAGPDAHGFLKGVTGGYVLRATVHWVD